MYTEVHSGTQLLFVCTAFYHEEEKKKKTQYELTGSKSLAELLKSIT